MNCAPDQHETESQLRRCQRDVNAIIDLGYQDAGSFASGTVSLTISHLSELQTFRSALARPLRKTMKSSGWNATTKSLSSRRIDTRFLGPIPKDFVSSIVTCMAHPTPKF